MDRAMVKLLMDPSSTLPGLAELLERPPWMARAACHGQRTDCFVPSGTRPSTAAKAVCARCPVRSECLAYALADESCVGIWGGTSTYERKSMRSADRDAARARRASAG